MITFFPECLYNNCDKTWRLDISIFSFIVFIPLFNEIIALYRFFSFSDRCSLSSKNPNRSASRPINSVMRYLASSKVNPSTLFNGRKITGYFPIYSSQSSLFFVIYNPSNNDSSASISKKERNILIFKVLPKRRGRVKRVTSPPVSTNCSISFVLSI